MRHIRETYDEFEKRGARVVVIMAESLARMQEFLETHKYPFGVLSDVRREAVKAVHYCTEALVSPRFT